MGGTKLDNAQESFYFGPGFHYTLDPQNVINFITYFSVSDTNSFSEGVVVNLQWVHPFWTYIFLEGSSLARAASPPGKQAACCDLTMVTSLTHHEVHSDPLSRLDSCRSRCYDTGVVRFSTGLMVHLALPGRALRERWFEKSVHMAPDAAKRGNTQRN